MEGAENGSPVDASIERLLMQYDEALADACDADLYALGVVRK